MSSLVSVITPVYNAEKCLERCIDSILKQSYSNFELLLIDDGSTDASGRICDQYAKTDSRIKVFHKRNGGVSSARNIGLRNVKGEWVTFIDSDDWVHPLYLEKLLGAEKNGVDLIISNCNVDVSEESSCKLIDGMNYSLIFFEDVSCYTVPWGKLYKANIIHDNNILFKEYMHLGEDAVFIYIYMIYSQLVCLLGDAGYNYNIDPTNNSLSKRIFTIESELYGYETVFYTIDKLLIVKDIKGVAADKLNQLKAFFVRRVLNSLYYNQVNKENRISILNKLNMEIYVHYIHPNSWKDKVFYWLLLCHFYEVYDMIRFCVVKLKSKKK